jgi:hypothetical protein
MTRRTTVRGPVDRAPALGAVAMLLVSAVGCGTGSGPQPAATSPVGLPRGDEPSELDPADFTAEITNPYWPMAPGDRWVYEETDGDGGLQLVEVTVLDETYTVAAGIEARVVHDVVTQDGAVVEDTLDWYAQDSAGNVWYLGEETAEYDDGQIVSTEGSWEAGVDGALAGVVVPAEPRAGLAYRQEYYADEAEDEAVVLSAAERVEGPTGRYDDALLTRDTTPLEPEIAELKFYAPGVGPVLVLQISGGDGREVLTASTRAG